MPHRPCVFRRLADVIGQKGFGPCRLLNRREANFPATDLLQSPKPWPLARRHSRSSNERIRSSLRSGPGSTRLSHASRRAVCPCTDTDFTAFPSDDARAWSPDNLRQCDAVAPEEHPSHFTQRSKRRSSEPPVSLVKRTDDVRVHARRCRSSGEMCGEHLFVTDTIYRLLREREE